MSNFSADPLPSRDVAGDVRVPPSGSGQDADTFGFWQHKSVEELAAQQGVQPIEDFQRFLDEIGDVWPEEESADDFIAWLRRSRREERDK
jgi:hypothetical protein